LHVVLWCKFFYNLLRKKEVAYILIMFLIVTNLYISLKLDGGGDVVLRHKNSIELHKKAINYCEQHKWYDKKIYNWIFNEI